MKDYKFKREVSFFGQDRFGEDYTIRTLIEEMLKNIPLEDLKKLFNVKVHDPRKEEDLKKFKTSIEAENYVYKQNILAGREVVEYQLKLKI